MGHKQSLKIFPSLLAADLSCLKEEIRVLEQFPIGGFHWDIMDHHFVDNLSFGIDLVQACRPHTNHVFQAHLMVSNPLDYIPLCAKAGVQIVYVHIEDHQHLLKALQSIGFNNMQAGIVYNPDTSLDSLPAFCHHIDHVLLMTVQPGFAGQAFLTNTLPKIAQAKSILASSKASLTVDGGITPHTAQDCYNLGVDQFVVGTSLLKGPHHEDRFHEIEDRWKAFFAF